MKCLTGGRYTMMADLMTLSAPGVPDGQTTEDGTSVLTRQYRNGVWFNLEIIQDPDSGAFERHWVPATNVTGSSDQNTPTAPSDGTTTVSFPCSARGFTDGGLRVVGTTERWSSRGYIQTIDTITLKFPANVALSDRDRITNLRDRRTGKILWVENDGTPTVFEATGSTPVFGPGGIHIENSALVNRAQVQGA